MGNCCITFSYMEVFLYGVFMYRISRYMKPWTVTCYLYCKVMLSRKLLKN